MSNSADTQLLSNADFVADASSGDPVAEKDDLLGTKLGNYVVDRVLGEGGMGRVYLAHHSRISQKYVAIKVLHPEFAGNSQMIGRFQREAETAFAITHPNVVTILDIDCTPRGLPYLVYEYLDGIDLSEHLDKVGKLALAEALHIGRQICQGVAAAHARGVIHRDLKPANVFLMGTFAKDAPERLCAKVLDFGLSRFLEPSENDQLTQQGLIMGTPAYMPPEQARAQKVDHRADVYGVGAILYTALTGRAPFESESPQATLVAVMTSDPPRPRSLEPSIPPHLELVIERAMAKEPADRYPDVLSLEEALEAVSAQLTSIAPDAALPRVRLPSIEWRETDADDIGAARPRLVLNLFAAVLLVIFAATTAIAGVELASGHVFDTVELRLCFLVIVVTSLPPAVLWLTRVRRHTWENSSRVLVLLGHVRAAVLAFVVTYGIAALVLHLVDDFLVRALGGALRPIGENWPGWSLLLPIMALIAASTAVMRRRVTAGIKAGWRRRMAVGLVLGLAAAAIGSIAQLGVQWHNRTAGAGAAGPSSEKPPP